MSPPLDKDGLALESAFLYLSRRPEGLTRLFQHLLTPAAQKELAQAAGRQKSGVTQPARHLVNAIPGLVKLRNLVLEATQDPAKQSPHADCLFGNLEEGWQNLAEQLKQNPEDFPALEDPKPADSSKNEAKFPQADCKETTRSAEQKRLEGLLDEKVNLQSRLKEAAREKSHLEKALNQERLRREEVKSRLEEALSQVRKEKNRATLLKKRLEEFSSASERESALAEAAQEARHIAQLAQQKLELLEDERDDLRAVLEDHDQFLNLPKEDVPSFRDRPLLDKEIRLKETISRHQKPLRILVVGGGEPQYKHRGKLDEYAQVLGFQADWRMAEYVSWHREVKALKRDMEERADALIILHWNRTTFTRKAREICNRANQSPCITCHYEGFTSLRESLQLCLGQLLRRG